MTHTSSSPTSFPPTDEQMALYRRGAVDLVEEQQLESKIERSRKTGEPLTIKTGFDPTSPDLHLGHTVLLRKMRHFQQMGHRVVFLMGDFTAMIGDPTGKKVTRPQLSREEVLANAQTYQDQVFRILDEDETVVQFNSEWLSALGSEGMIRLAGSYTLARMMEREDFKTRYENNQPISIHELLYPLAQGYDSVAMEADVELGGHDQLLNLLIGRDLMKERGMEPQCVLTVPLLVGTDGVDKMSKSLGNAIDIEDTARDMYGKVMSIPDDLMWDWLVLLTDIEDGEIASLKQKVESGTAHPKVTKQRLARSIVRDYHGQEAAQSAEQEFQTIFAKGGRPDDVPTHEAEADTPLLDVLVAVDFAQSKSAGRRLMQQGAVSLDGEKVTDVHHRLLARDQAYELKAGKRKFLDLQVR